MQLHLPRRVGVRDDSTPFPLGWLLHSLMSVICTLCEDAFPGQRHQMFVVSVHISASEHSSTFSVSDFGDAGLCGQWLSHGNVPCGWLFSGRSTFPRGTGSRWDPTCSVCTSSRAIGRNQALPAIWSETVYALKREWGQNPFDWKLQGFIFNAESKIHFMVENTCCWMMFTRKEHLRRLFWKLRAKRRMFVCYVPVSLTSGIHSK